MIGGEPHTINYDLATFGSKIINQLLIHITRRLSNFKYRKIHKKAAHDVSKATLLPCSSSLLVSQGLCSEGAREGEKSLTRMLML